MAASTAMLRPFSRADLGAVPAGWQVGPPDFVGAGCGKAGSSWWYSLISGHPQVVPNRLGWKELHYFGHMGWRRPEPRELEVYREAFARPAGHVCGEWSASYVYQPFTLESLAEAAPGTRLIVTLRNPVDRMASLLNQLVGVRAGRIGAAGDGLTLLERWSLFPEAAYQVLVAPGLARLRDLFPPEQILFVQYERAREDPAGELARTFRFLGVDDGWTHGDERRAVNRRPYVVPRPTPDDRRRIAAWAADDVRRTAELVPELDLGLWRDFRNLAPVAPRA